MIRQQLSKENVLMNDAKQREPLCTPSGEEFTGNTWCSTHIAVEDSLRRLQVWNNQDGSLVGIDLEGIITLGLDFRSAAALSHVLNEAILSCEKLHDPEIQAIRSCAGNIKSMGCNCSNRKPQETVSILRLGGHYFDCPQSIASDLMLQADEKSEELQRKRQSTE